MNAAPLLHVAQVIDDAVGDLTCLKVGDSSACDSIHYQLSSSAQTASLIRCLCASRLIATDHTVGLSELCRAMNLRPAEGKPSTSDSQNNRELPCIFIAMLVDKND
jgi:hypothetical protein